MGRIGPLGRRGARRDVGASGKRRNAPRGPIRPTEGRVLLGRGRVAHLGRCPTSPREALLTTTQDNPVKLGPINPDPL